MFMLVVDFGHAINGLLSWILVMLVMDYCRGFGSCVHFLEIKILPLYSLNRWLCITVDVLLCNNGIKLDPWISVKTMLNP